MRVGHSSRGGKYSDIRTSSSRLGQSGRLLDQEILQGLLDANQPAFCVVSREGQRGIAISLEDEQRRDGCAKVIGQRPFETKNGTHRCIWSCDRLVIYGEAILYPSHINGFAFHPSLQRDRQRERPFSLHALAQIGLL